MSNELIDVIDNETLDEVVRREIQARMTISAALDRTKLLDILRSIIDGSQCLNFATERARRFISASRPEMRLMIDRVAVGKHHPAIYQAMMEAETDEEMIKAKDELVAVEVKHEIIEFFTGVFMLILKGSYLTSLSDKQKERVENITKGLDLDFLRKTVNDITKLRDKDGNLTNELGFTWHVISAVTFPSEEGEVMENDLTVIEIVY